MNLIEETATEVYAKETLVLYLVHHIRCTADMHL